ncbi:hypothetical protein NFI96_006706, partial [Prochilodus magdalenae]
MELAEKLVVLYSLFGVSMCRDVFSVTLPQSVEAVNGLCVLINCSFTINETQYDKDLQNNPKGIWFKDGTEDDKTVFDSTTPESNKIKGRITGDLQKKDCTTIFNRINKNDTGTYYFRIEAGELKYTYQTPSVSLHVRDPPKNTSVSVSPSGPVVLGRSVSLNCSSDGNPAVNYTWHRQNGEQIGTGPSLTIKTDDTHSGLYCRAQNQHGAQNSFVQLDIQYGPQISLSSNCNTSSEGVIQCVCEVHGRPVPKVEWCLSGKPIPPSLNSFIREESVGRTGLRSVLSMHLSLTEMLGLLCISTNKLGSTSQLFSFVTTGQYSDCPPKQRPVTLLSSTRYCYKGHLSTASNSQTPNSTIAKTKELSKGTRKKTIDLHQAGKSESTIGKQ